MSTTEETPTAEPKPAPQDSEELIAARMDAAGARHGLDDAYSEVARALLPAWLAEKKLGPSKEHVDRFVGELKKSKPALFTSMRRADTAPVPRAGAPAAPAAGGPIDSPHAKWAALRASGQRVEAEAYYRLNRSAIVRGQE